MALINIGKCNFETFIFFLWKEFKLDGMNLLTHLLPLALFICCCSIFRPNFFFLIGERLGTAKLCLASQTPTIALENVHCTNNNKWYQTIVTQTETHTNAATKYHKLHLLASMLDMAYDQKQNYSYLPLALPNETP